MTNPFVGNWDSIWIGVSGVRHRTQIVIVSDIGGTYKYDVDRNIVHGQLRGKLNHGNRIFAGKWKEFDGKNTLTNSGNFHFTLSFDGQWFHGDWSFLDSPRNYFDWFAHRANSVLSNRESPDRAPPD